MIPRFRLHHLLLKLQMAIWKDTVRVTSDIRPHPFRRRDPGYARPRSKKCHLGRWKRSILGCLIAPRTSLIFSGGASSMNFPLWMLRPWGHFVSNFFSRHEPYHKGQRQDDHVARSILTETEQPERYNACASRTNLSS